MGTGLIYAMVIVLWGIVLLPMWLNNHEQSNEGKQVDRFRRAMTSLQLPTDQLIANSQQRQVQAKRAVRAGVEVRPTLSPAARRRRVLGGLVAAQAVVLLALPLGAPRVAAFVPLAAIAAFLVMARGQVRREHAARTPVAAPTHASSSLIGFARALAGTRAARRPVGRAPQAVEQAPAAPTADASTSWQPVRTPAPTYVSAPAATTVPRAIDLGSGWTGAAMVEAARAMAETPDAIDVLAAPSMAYTADLDITMEIPVIRHSA